MGDPREVPYHIVGGVGIRGAAWAFSNSVSARAAKEAILAENLFTPNDEAILAVGKRMDMDDDEDGRVLVFLFAAIRSRNILEMIRPICRIVVDSQGSTIMDWKVVPATLVGQAFLLLLERMAENRSRANAIPSFFRRMPTRDTAIPNENVRSCSECGTAMVRRGIGYMCLNCGATLGYP